MRRSAAPCVVPTQSARRPYVARVSASVELLLLGRRLPSAPHPTIGIVSRAEVFFRRSSRFGERAPSRSDANEGFETGGTGWRQRANDRSMAAMVAGDVCAESFLGVVAGTLARSGGREELAARIASGFWRGRANGARSGVVFSASIVGFIGQRFLMVAADPQKMLWMTPA